MMVKTLIAVVGPTAIGKTGLAIALAEYFNAEVISADSRQFYKEMRIGTAVPDDNELQRVPHHFIQHKSIHDNYSVGDFERDAIALIENRFQVYDVLILVGGSGLYVEAVTRGFDAFPVIDPNIRLRLNREYNDHGIEFLQQKLLVEDASYYNKVDLNNPQRLIRALEVCVGTGKPYSTFLKSIKKKRSFKTLTVGISADRALIYERINTRVDLMMGLGLLEEARKLYRYKSLNALQTVGYKELFDYFDEKYDLPFAISEIKKNTRRFAKRQLTWFRKDNSILWVNCNDPTDQTIAQITNHKEFN